MKFELFTKIGCHPCEVLKIQLDSYNEGLMDYIQVRPLAVPENLAEALERGVRAAPAAFVDGVQTGQQAFVAAVLAHHRSLKSTETESSET